MSKRDWSKVPRPSGWSPGNGETEVTEEEVRRLTEPPWPEGTFVCWKCEVPTVPTWEEPRRLPLRYCPECRSELEAEAALNGLPLLANDEDLINAIAEIARLEGLRAHAEGRKQMRRARRIDKRIARVRGDLVARFEPTKAAA